MGKLCDDGRVRAIGVSNFRISELELVLDSADIQPACNQIEIHPYFTQPEVRAFCQDQNIQVVSYSPLGTGDWSNIPRASKPVADPVIKEIAANHELAPAQVILRWNLEHGWVPVPKSENPDRMKQNIELDHFTLSDTELKRIDNLETNQRFNTDPEKAIVANLQIEVPS